MTVVATPRQNFEIVSPLHFKHYKRLIASFAPHVVYAAWHRLVILIEQDERKAIFQYVSIRTQLRRSTLPRSSDGGPQLVPLI